MLTIGRVSKVQVARKPVFQHAFLLSTGAGGNGLHTLGPKTPARGHTCGPTPRLEEQMQEPVNKENKIKSLFSYTQKAEAFTFYSHDKMEQWLLPPRHSSPES